MPNPDYKNPLICALDGALLKTDLKSEKLLFGAKSGLDHLMSSEIDLQRLELERADPTVSSFELPLNQEVCEFLAAEKSKGRRLILDTPESIDSIKEILSDKNPFDETIDLENQQFPDSYDYVGNNNTSDSIWERANKKYIVGNTEAPSGFTSHFKTPKTDIKTIIKAIRSYQWLKNLLVFVPIITSQQLSNLDALLNSFIMFCCFSAVASFGYIFNDLLDLQSDRAHHIKRYRPFASGQLSATQGMLIGAVLLFIAIAGCLFLPAVSAWVLLAYFLLTICYSIYLKTKLMIDVVSLGGLFTLRVIGGAAALESELSFYLLSFSIFLFSSLGMVKRFAELHNLQAKNKLSARGRGYRVEDMAPVRIIGISLGYMSVFIMGLYINSPLITQYYSNPKIIWLLFPLLTYWLGRLWILANRGEVNEDPLIFAAKDRTSLLVAAISAVILILAD